MCSAMSEKPAMNSSSSFSYANAGVKQAVPLRVPFRSASPLRSARRYAQDTKSARLEGRERHVYCLEKVAVSDSPSCAWDLLARQRWKQSILRPRLCRCQRLCCPLDARARCVFHNHGHASTRGFATASLLSALVLTVVLFRRAP